MQLHNLKPTHKLKRKKRIGRGGKRGTYSGRGIKGQKARAGRKFKPLIRELIKRYPKLRGYRQKLKKEKRELQVLNLIDLEKKFESGEKVNLKTLLEKKMINKIRGRFPKIKILAKGEIKKPLIIEGLFISKKAKEKIEKTGGKVI
jgi:large subunit ribosomal protein L15